MRLARPDFRISKARARLAARTWKRVRDYRWWWETKLTHVLLVGSLPERCIRCGTWTQNHT